MPDPLPPERPERAGRSRGAPRPGARRPPEGRPAGRPEPRTGPPAGDGWDDGRGNRSGGDRARRPAGAAGPARRTGRFGGLPRWVPAAGAAVVVLLLVVVLVVVVGGGDDEKDGGTCLADLAVHLPASSTLAYGTDLIRARDEGYVDDGELEELGESQRETGAIPDALTSRYRFAELVTTEQFTARTGVEPADIDCSLSDGRRTVMSGSFDPAEVSGSSAADGGQVAATEDRLAFTVGNSDPEKLLEERDGGGLAADEAVDEVLTSLRDAGAYSVVAQVGNPEAEKRARVAGLGVGQGEGDDRTLLVAWAYGSEDAAEAGRPDLVDTLNEVLSGNTQVTVDDLVLDGPLVTATIVTRKAPELDRVVRSRLELIPRG